jgi:hypothetical protein
MSFRLTTITIATLILALVTLTPAAAAAQTEGGGSAGAGPGSYEARVAPFLYQDSNNQALWHVEPELRLSGPAFAFVTRETRARVHGILLCEPSVERGATRLTGEWIQTLTVMKREDGRGSWEPAGATGEYLMGESLYVQTRATRLPFLHGLWQGLEGIAVRLDGIQDGALAGEARFDARLGTLTMADGSEPPGGAVVTVSFRAMPVPVDGQGDPRLVEEIDYLGSGGGELCH